MSYAKGLGLWAIFNLGPYALVSWGYAYLVNGGSEAFSIALAVLLVARLFFYVLEAIGGIAAWHLHTKRVVVERILGSLRANKFPARQDPNHDFLAYLFTVYESREQPEAVRNAARQMENELLSAEHMGMLAGMRLHAAGDAALNKYSPKK